MDCQRCGGVIVRRRTGPEGPICERCYSRAYHRRKIEARCAAQLGALLDVVAGVAPELDRAAMVGAIERAAPTELEQKRALEYLLSVPDALRTGSPHVPQVVARLAAELVAAGTAAVVRPACPRCGRAVELPHPTSEGRVCAGCYAVERAAECGRCGMRRRIITRTPDGLPMCSSCRNRDESRWEACTGCNRTRPVNARTDDGSALCNTCCRQPGLPCDSCGNVGMIVSRKGGRMLCTRCYRRPVRPCGGCGRVRRVALRANGDQPDLCPACHWAAVATCIRCGEEGPSRGVQKGEPVCLRCLAIARLDEILTGEDGRVPETLASLRDVIISAEQPRTLFVWLDRSPGVTVLRNLVTGEVPLTHEGLDALPQNASLNHLRQLLVACAALPQRDPNLARLERSIEVLAAALDQAEDRQVLRAFARWRVLRRARSRSDKGEFTSIRAKNARTVVAEAAGFLAWLRSLGLSLRDCSQADVDVWLSSGLDARRRIGEFLRWARTQRAVGDVSVPAAGNRHRPSLDRRRGAVDHGATTHPR